MDKSHQKVICFVHCIVLCFWCEFQRINMFDFSSSTEYHFYRQEYFSILLLNFARTVCPRGQEDKSQQTNICVANCLWWVSFLPPFPNPIPILLLNFARTVCPRDWVDKSQQYTICLARVNLLPTHTAKYLLFSRKKERQINSKQAIKTCSLPKKVSKGKHLVTQSHVQAKANKIFKTVILNLVMDILTINNKHDSYSP